MRWGDESYVRVYTRDTGDWVALGWEAQALFLLTMRKVDRAGILQLGKSGVRGLAGLVAMPVEVVERALQVLLEDGCVALNGTTLVMPNFIEAQEASQTDAQRKREQRARDRDLAAASVTFRDGWSRNVTECHANPDSGHEVSQPVTHSCAVPSFTVPSEKHALPARARDERQPDEAPRKPAPAPPPAAVDLTPLPETPPPRPRAADGLPKNHVERFKASLELLDVLEAGGWTAGLPKTEPERLAVEEAVRAVTVPVAAERLLAMVATQRAAGNVPSPWLGWHKAVILDRAEGESQARAPPAPAKRVIAKAASAADMAGGEHGFRR